MDKYFKKIDDLVDTGKKDFPKKDVDASGYFHPAEDLKPISTVEEMVDYFRPAGDLDDDEKRLIFPKESTDYFTPFKNPDEMVDYFRPAGDLNKEKNINITNNLINIKNNEIDDYLLTVTSGKKYDSVCELGVLMGSGRTVVTFDELKQMVEQGYNIVKSSIISADMIEVEFQRFVYDEELMEKRRRF